MRRYERFDNTFDQSYQITPGFDERSVNLTIGNKTEAIDLFARHEEFRNKSILAVKQELKELISDLDDKTKSAIMDKVKGIRDRIAHTERIHGVQRFIEGMLDAEVPDQMIVSLLEKHWYLNAEKAAKKVYEIKTVVHPINEVCQYMNMMGFSTDEILEIASSETWDELHDNHNLWKLSAADLYKYLSDKREEENVSTNEQGLIEKAVAAHMAKGIVKKLISKPVNKLSMRLKQGEECEKPAIKIKRIINGPEDEDIEVVKRKLEHFGVEDDNSEVPTLEELKARLEALEGDTPFVDEFEEPVATRLGYEDDLFTFMSEIDLSEEDEPLIRLATNHPAYKSFAKSYHGYKPEDDELQTVKAFVSTMAPRTTKR